MPIEFDPAKDAANIALRGISLALAETMFGGFVIEEIDDRFDYGETRIIAFGEVEGRVFACVYTLRATTRRIISLRPASRKERANYENAKRDQG